MVRATPISAFFLSTRVSAPTERFEGDRILLRSPSLLPRRHQDAVPGLELRLARLRSLFKLPGRDVDIHLGAV